MRSTLIVGSFMALGLQDCINASSELLDHWGCGHYELVDTMLDHAAYADALLNAGLQIEEPCGVAAYEVAEEFGAWYGKQVLESAQGTAPDADACRAKLRILVTTFFNPMNTAQMSAVLAAVPIPETAT